MDIVLILLKCYGLYWNVCLVLLSCIRWFVYGDKNAQGYQCCDPKDKYILSPFDDRLKNLAFRWNCLQPGEILINIISNSMDPTSFTEKSLLSQSTAQSINVTFHACSGLKVHATNLANYLMFVKVTAKVLHYRWAIYSEISIMIPFIRHTPALKDYPLYIPLLTNMTKLYLY